MVSVRIIVAFAALLLFGGAAHAQCNGQFASGYLCGNVGASQAQPHPADLNDFLDRNFAPAQGTILNRGLAVWSATATPVLGNPGVASGSLGFASVAGGAVTITAPPIAGAVNFQLPPNNGTAGYVLTTDGAGNGAWTALSGVSVTAISNSDGTLTISPTTGNAIASLNLAHSNSWTAAQIFQATSAPASAAGNTAVLGTLAALPSLSDTGQGLVFNRTADGLVLQGDGSSNDLKLANKFGTSVCTVATGGTTLACTSMTLTNQLPLASGGAAGGANDQLLQGVTSSAPQWVGVNDCSNALTYSTTTHTFGCNSIVGTGTVTSVATSGFITGGTITTTGTVSGAFLGGALATIMGAL